MHNKRYAAIEEILATFAESYVDIERYELGDKIVYSSSVYVNSEASQVDLASNYDNSIFETMRMLNEKCFDWLEEQELAAQNPDSVHAEEKNA